MILFPVQNFKTRFGVLFANMFANSLNSVCLLFVWFTGRATRCLQTGPVCEQRRRGDGGGGRTHGTGDACCRRCRAGCLFVCLNLGWHLGGVCKQRLFVNSQLIILLNQTRSSSINCQSAKAKPNQRQSTIASECRISPESESHLKR